MRSSYNFSTKKDSDEIPLLPLGLEEDVVVEYTDITDDFSVESVAKGATFSIRDEHKSSTEIAELSSACLNKLLDQQINSPEIKNHLVEAGILKIRKDNNGHARNLKYYIIEKHYPLAQEIKSEEKIEREEEKTIKKRLVFFETTKDAETVSNQPHLFSVSNLFGDKTKPVEIEHKTLPPKAISLEEFPETLTFYEREQKEKSVFIMPLHQCRGIFSLPPDYASKSHVVLAIYDNADNTLKVYDSQRGVSVSLPFVGYVNLPIPTPNFVYPDKFREMPGIEYKGVTSLGIQKHPHLCGYFVNTMRAMILENGDVEQFENIILNPEIIINKEYYMANHIGITKTILQDAAIKLTDSLLNLEEKLDDQAWVRLDLDEKEDEGFEMEVMVVTKEELPPASRYSDVVSSSSAPTLFSSSKVNVDLTVTAEGLVKLALRT